MSFTITDASTGVQIAAARAQLERHAALLLGRLLFAYARLESAPDLCLVWVDDGKDLEAWTRKIERMNFGAKRGLLKARAARQACAASRTAYAAWLARAHVVRERRNVLAHGRLGVNVRRGSLSAVLSRATSATMQAVEFPLADLEWLVAEADCLQRELSDLRSSFPLSTCPPASPVPARLRLRRRAMPTAYCTRHYHALHLIYGCAT